jgi:hypothetical protein
MGMASDMALEFIVVLELGTVLGMAFELVIDIVFEFWHRHCFRNPIRTESIKLVCLDENHDVQLTSLSSGLLLFFNLDMIPGLEEC